MALIRTEGDSTMRVNIVMEAEVSSVALKPDVGGVPLLVPQSIWVILGDFEPIDEDDGEGFDFRPIQERDPETGTYRKNHGYLMSGLAHEDFLQIVKSHQSVKLIESCTELALCLQAVKALKDIFDKLGHEVFLLETCDY